MFFFFFILFCFFFFFFFFSSRRRHTRLVSDWSSECALPILYPFLQARPASDRNWAWRNGYRAASAAASYAVAASLGRSAFSYAAPSRPYVCARKYLSALGEIGRASCRERVSGAVGEAVCKIR